MAANLPIASSNRGPMPEVLGPDGFYFDPDCPDSIAETLSHLAQNTEGHGRPQRLAFERAQQYTWARCSSETWRILALTARGLPANHDIALNREEGP
jgi:glycosyltransferase involved in cell wall biosynthesis